MKKTMCLILACVLMVLSLSACSNNQQNDAAVTGDANFHPDTTAVPNPSAQDVANVLSGENTPLDETHEIPLDEKLDEPLTDAPEPTAEPMPETSPETAGSGDAESASLENELANYKFETLTDTSFGFVFTHPTHWQSLPGKSTVCFREAVEEGDFPARVAVSKKKLVHTPDEDAIIDQFKSYAAIIRTQYDPTSFEFGTLNSEAKFMNQKKAYSITYLAYSGETEVMGYMVVCAIQKTMYVFHFCASYADYVAMKPMMELMRDSVALVEQQ